MAAFSAVPDVAYVIPDRRMYAAAVSPNDTEYSRQWDLLEAGAGRRRSAPERHLVHAQQRQPGSCGRELRGNAPAGLKVGVDINHTFRGDLKIEIVAPNGASAVLKDVSTSDSADNVLTTYTVDASSLAANGTWTLRVTDAHSGDTGYIDSWNLT